MASTLSSPSSPGHPLHPPNRYCLRVLPLGLVITAQWLLDILHPLLSWWLRRAPSSFRSWRCDPFCRHACRRDFSTVLVLSRSSWTASWTLPWARDSLCQRVAQRRKGHEKRPTWWSLGDRDSTSLLRRCCRRPQTASPSNSTFRFRVPWPGMMASFRVSIQAHALQHVGLAVTS